MTLGQDFRAFVLRGNVIDLAVAVVIGAAFGAVVTALVEDLITPLIAAIGGQPDFSEISFTINNSEFLIGDFLNTVISFLIIAAVIFFFVVKPMNLLLERSRREPTPDPSTTKCPACLSEIALGASRCPFCTTELTDADTDGATR
ncbi:MAG: large conductance mechanosensitive channel protein MscL [Chloroflexia bacterium]|nr:large conductance mechanosensitive channel protein MscL [Chloroflexia bacterium]